MTEMKLLSLNFTAVFSLIASLMWPTNSVQALLVIYISPRSALLMFWSAQKVLYSSKGLSITTMVNAVKIFFSNLASLTHFRKGVYCGFWHMLKASTQLEWAWLFSCFFRLSILNTFVPLFLAMWLWLLGTHSTVHWVDFTGGRLHPRVWIG